MGDRVAFTGSANDSINGHSQNYESIDVYRSWLPADEERVNTKLQAFEEAWSEKAVGLKILSLSQEAIAFVRSHALSEKPLIFPTSIKLPPSTVSELPNYQWRHQEEAVKRFLEIGHGVLEMATGTGKNRTTLKILSRLDEQKTIEGIIISTVENDLLDQWCKELESWSIKCSRTFRVLKHYESHHQLESFANNPKGAVIVISREKLASLLYCLQTNVILFSSARAKLETIQRIGRCLRINPNSPHKRATVVDFVLKPDEKEQTTSADEELK